MRSTISHLVLAAVLLMGISSVATSQPPIGSENATTAVDSPENPTPLGWPSPSDVVSRNRSDRTAQTDLVGAAGDMIGFSHADGSGTQIITLVDTGKSWMAVYHIDRSGTIRLVSSRPIDADFSLQLNATSPLPDEIRGIGRARK